MNYTPEQYATIHAENKELLVSASAGTGKTEVLTERIVDMITRRGYSIDRMVIVTFTRAAAAEMRARLSKKLMAAAENDPRLREQCDLVPLAQISTIDSLCQKIVRSHFEAVDIDPAFTIVSGADEAKLKEESLEEAMNRLYELAAEEEDIRALTTRFSDDEISSMASRLYPFLMARPDPMAFLEKCAATEFTEENLEEQPFMRYLQEEGRKAVDFAMELWSQTVRMLESDKIDHIFAKNIAADGETLGGLRQLHELSCRSFVEALANASWVRKTSARANKEGIKPAGSDIFDEQRKAYMGLIKKFGEKLPKNTDGMLADLNQAQSALRGLKRLMELFTEVYREKKDQRHAADFADIQHLALKILRNEDLQRDVSSRYDAVFVDEVQDVSLLQEELLRLLVREGGSSFQVGDVKQSIYRFRQAEPSLFLGKLASFQTDPSVERRKIFLRDNFRSVSTVQRAVNHVFSHVMRGEVTDIDYDEDAMLTRPKESEGDEAFELHILSDDGEEKIAGQAAWIGGDILQRVGKPLGAGEKLRFGDILILMPVAAGLSDRVQGVLEGLGIPVNAEGGGNAATSPEIQQVLAVLRCFTNCRDDFSLLAALRSPFLRFKEDELAKIRLCRPERERSYYEALLAASEEAEEPLREKCRQTLETLNRERELSRRMPLDQYLWDLLRRSGYYLYVGQGGRGEQAQANLSWLCERALEWEENAGGSPAAFAKRMLEEAKQKDGDKPTAVSLGENAVRVMTIHKSKGLGARLVYVMNLERKLKQVRREGCLCWHNRLGVALETRNPDLKTRRRTVLQRAIEQMEDHEELAEKARLLYVAMTRAKEKLVMVASGVNLMDGMVNIENWQRQCNMLGVKTAASYADWLLQCAGEGDELRELRLSFADPADEGKEKSEGQNADIKLLNVTEIVTNNEPVYPQDCGFLSTFELQKHGFPHVEKAFSQRVSTGFPHISGDFHYIFHNSPISHLEMWKTFQEDTEKSVGKPVENSMMTNCNNSVLSVIWPEEDGIAGIRPREAAEGLDHKPAQRKIGVTKLVASRLPAEKPPLEGNPQEDLEETREDKRVPLESILSRTEETRLPAFMLEDASRPQGAAFAGTINHLVLELIDLKAAAAYEGNMDNFVRGQLARMVRRHVLKSEEAALVMPEAIANFLVSPLAMRLNASPRVERELSFTLRLREEGNTLVQGIIDLCFLEKDGWVLVDFKTDHVRRAEELIGKYAAQVGYYPRALEEGTGLPVKEVLLYSLRLSKAAKL